MPRIFLLGKKKESLPSFDSGLFYWNSTLWYAAHFRPESGFGDPSYRKKSRDSEIPPTEKLNALKYNKQSIDTNLRAC